jgi:hypothetical protein
MLLGRLPPSDQVNGGYVNDPIVFLLESPGGHWGSSVVAAANGHQKRPPVSHYYWSPDPALPGWPTEPGSLPNLYGSYFAYLMRQFGLRNVYITNAVKCGKTLVDKPGRFEFFDMASEADRRVLANCYQNFLRLELRQINPVLIFAFGCRAWHLLKRASGKEPVPLLHPAARKSREKLVCENNRRIMEALARRGYTAA